MPITSTSIRLVVDKDSISWDSHGGLITVDLAVDPRSRMSSYFVAVTLTGLLPTGLRVEYICVGVVAGRYQAQRPNEGESRRTRLAIKAPLSHSYLLLE